MLPLEIIWRKSSYSDNGGLNCVEVGAWRKASGSSGQGQCVEVALGERMIAVRDSKNPDGGKLAFSMRAWGALTEKFKKDLPLS